MEKQKKRSYTLEEMSNLIVAEVFPKIRKKQQELKENEHERTEKAEGNSPCEERTNDTRDT
jgi:hypothetical protein